MLEFGASGVLVRIAENGREYQMNFLRLAEELAGFFSEFRFRGRNHAEKVFRLLGFLHAAADDVSEIFFRDAFVRLAVVRPNARAAADELIDQPVSVRAARDFFQETDDSFSETRRALFEIERMLGAIFRRILTHGPS